MTDKKFEVGDRVRVTRKLRQGEDDHYCNWVYTMDGMVGKEYTVKHISELGNYCLDGYYFPPAVLRGVGKSHAACVLTEKVTVGGVPCRKILGFEGILPCDELPEKYVEGTPVFWLDSDGWGRHVFRDGHFCWEDTFKWKGNCIRMYLPGGIDIDVGHFGFTGIQEGSVWPETTFQELLTWLKRAGSRLAKIRKQEKDAWSGKEMVEI